MYRVTSYNNVTKKHLLPWKLSGHDIDKFVLAFIDIFSGTSKSMGLSPISH